MTTPQTPAGGRAVISTRPLFVALTYGVLSCAWILLSDEYLAHLALAPDTTSLMSIVKGFLYVAITSTIIYRLVMRLDQIKGNLEEIVSTRTRALAQSEASLRKTQDRFAQLLANLPDVTWTAEKNGRTTYISPNVQTLFGFTAEEICARNADPWLAHIHPSDQVWVSEAYERLFEMGETFDVEYRVQRKDGQWIWVHDHAMGTHKDGASRIADGILSDITARKRAEEAREESDRRYQSLFERIPAGVFRSTIEGRILDCNPALKRMLGYGPSDEAPTSYSSDVFFDPAGAEQAYEKLMAERALTNYEIKLKRKDGTPLWVLENLSLMSNDCGQPAIVEGTLVDITDRKLMEDELRLQRKMSERHLELVATLLGEAPVELAMFDRKMVYLEASQRWCSRYGLERESILGRSHYDVLPNLPKEWKEAHRRGLAGEVLKSERDSFVTLDGKESFLRWEIMPWGDVKADTGGIIIFSEDITEQCHLEQQFLKAQRMEAVGQLAAGVAHNFNNMLTVILGAAQLIEASPSDSEQVTRFAQRIVHASRRAGSVVNQLLTFSRNQALEMELTDLNSVVSEVRDMLQSLPMKDIQLVVEQTTSTTTVHVGRAQLDQAITNLVTNARDAMPEGGTMTIETLTFSTDKRLSLPNGSDVAPGEYVVLSITDTGCGMDEQTRARIFEPFFTTKPVGKGTGLGLAAVYGVVKQCGGSISVKSEIGRGTCFRLFLPHAKCAPGFSRPAESAAPAQHNKRESILLVEDEPDVAAVICSYLTAQGYEVLSAKDGVSALEQAAATRRTIDLLLTDVVMPRIGGAELAQQMSVVHPETRVLFMSGHADPFLDAKALEKASVLQKPFALSKLSQAIREVLRASFDGGSEREDRCPSV